MLLLLARQGGVEQKVVGIPERVVKLVRTDSEDFGDASSLWQRKSGEDTTHGQGQTGSNGGEEAHVGSTCFARGIVVISRVLTVVAA